MKIEGEKKHAEKNVKKKDSIERAIKNLSVKEETINTKMKDPKETPELDKIELDEIAKKVFEDAWWPIWSQDEIKPVVTLLKKYERDPTVVRAIARRLSSNGWLRYPYNTRPTILRTTELLSSEEVFTCISSFDNSNLAASAANLLGGLALYADYEDAINTTANYIQKYKDNPEVVVRVLISLIQIADHMENKENTERNRKIIPKIIECISKFDTPEAIVEILDELAFAASWESDKEELLNIIRKISNARTSEEAIQMAKEYSKRVSPFKTEKENLWAKELLRAQDTAIY